MTEPHPPIDVAELITSQRDLSEAEQQYLMNFADDAWASIREQLNTRAHNAYAIASPADFAECVGQHMSADDGRDMVASQAYHCPVCGRHLKDRRTPVASSVLAERRRLRELYRAIEHSPEGPARDEATRRFIAALGWT